MGKKDIIDELTNLLAISLRHKIGSIVNQNEIYASKYAKDADVLMNEAKRDALKENWNQYDKLNIKEILQKKLKLELEKKDFLDSKKFEIMDEEIEIALVTLDLVS
ncbi:MAG: hypothetical protein NT076_01075 [Candidatus Pacearchaeota archaeon]|nr:hypothetical protein [Candidatus Pacearchaeota archaeon]